METFEGIVTWVQKEWDSYRTSWGRNNYQEFRKFYLLLPNAESIECVAWGRKYWTAEPRTGQKVTIKGIKKTNKFNKTQIALRDVKLGDFHREFKTFTIQNVTFRHNYIDVQSESPWIRGKVPDENVHPILNKYRHLISESISATIEGEPRAVRFEHGKPISWIFDQESRARITERSWGALEKAVEQDEEAKRWKQFILSLKTKLETNTITLDEAQKLADEQNVICTEQDILSVIFTPEYEKEYFDHLKVQAVITKYTKDSFLFQLKDGTIVWEKPKIGSATYIFNPQDINILTSRIDALQSISIRSAIRSNTNNIATELQFSKIIIHRDFEQWSSEISNLEEKHSV